LSARAANEFVLLAVDVVKPVGRTRAVSSHCILKLIDVLYFNERKKRKYNV
jgi:hypothetical protein